MYGSFGLPFGSMRSSNSSQCLTAEYEVCSCLRDGTVALPFDTQLVLATVPGYPAVVRVWNRTELSSSGCYPENRSTHRVRGRIGTEPQFQFTVPTTLAPIQYLSSDCIATWSICEMCRLMPYFISRSQICDRINIHWVAVKLSENHAKMTAFSSRLHDNWSDCKSENGIWKRASNCIFHI
jgi:hypothetical protein